MTATADLRAPWSRRWTWSALVVSLGIVALVWCHTYGRWSPDSWRLPPSYEGDSWGTLAAIKAVAQGEITPLLSKNPKSLGAPFAANWNDYPTTEEGTLAWLGLLARVFGLFAGANAALLAAHLLAAAGFLLVCRHLRYDVFFSSAAAILFALSRYSFARGFSHITVTYYWHVPLSLLVIFWCLQPAPLLNDRRKLWLSIAIALLHGIQNPYYTGLFGQFLLCTALIIALGGGDWRRVCAPLFLAAILVATFALMNAETFLYRLHEGPNPAAVTRGYQQVELYALKPIELFLPVGHRLSRFNDWAADAYFNRAHFLGEISSPYLGLVGIAALAMLVWSAAKAVAVQDLTRFPRHLWGVLWILAYSAVGGLNSLLGVAGLILFRSSNRYSIAILALLLLFLVRQVSAFTRSWRLAMKALLAALVLALGVADQVPKEEAASTREQLREMVASDAAFVSSLEGRLPRDAMVFQLPVMEFPEVMPVVQLADYEHFRPYFFSQHLRFSYGSDKGRPRERWQQEAVRLGPARLVQLLERYGFSSILIAREGYADRGAALQENLRSIGRGTVIAASPDWISIKLDPRANPPLPPEFDKKWRDLQTDGARNWRWSRARQPMVILHNPSREPFPVRLAFTLQTPVARKIEITLNKQVIYTSALVPEQPGTPVDLRVTLAPGRNELGFRTDALSAPATDAGGAKVTFALVNFALGE